MRLQRLSAVLIVLLCATFQVEAATATWDRNPEPNIVGYRLSYGTQPGVHTVSIDVGNVTTHQFFPPPGQRYYIVVQARNSSGVLSPKSNEVIYDAPATTNQPPTLTQPANQSTLHNTAASLSLVASDPEGATLRFTATGLPPGLAINATSGVISGTAVTIGTFNVTATVSDGALSASRSFTWTVRDTTLPTVAITAPANQATVSGTNVTVSATASDAAGIAGVQFRLDGAAIGAEDTTAPYSVVWNTTTTANGAHQLTAVARDGSGNVATSSAVTVTVSNTTANRAPVLEQPANQTSAEGATVTVALRATDPDNDPLTYSATGLPPRTTINATTGVITAAPRFSSAGTYTVRATVSDGRLTHSRTFSWIVTNTNRQPTLEQPENQASASGATVSLQLSGSDPDGTPVTYQATDLPPNLTVNATTGLISGTLSADAIGVYDVTVSVSDGALSATQTFTWSVDGTDVPVRGDFDGDGRGDLATYRQATGEWRIWASASGHTPWAPIEWGSGADMPVAADYDGDRRTDVAVFRPSTGVWHVAFSSTNMQSGLQIQWGNASDRPVPIDYDNDGRADLALPRFGGFEILWSGSNYTQSVIVR